MRADLRVMCFLACVCAFVRPAAAQSGGNPDDATIRFGPLGINPTFAMRNVGVDNNVFNEAQNPKSDFTFTLTPGVQVVFQPRRLTLSYSGTSDYVYYKKYTTERSTNGRSEVRGDLDVGIFTFSASAAGLNSRERLNAEIDARARHHDTLYSAGFGVHLASRTTLLATVRRTNQIFDPGDYGRFGDLSQTMNSHIEGVDGTLGLELTPLTKLEVIATRERQRFDSAPERNSHTLRIAPTVTFSPGGLFTGSATVGYRQTTGDSAALQNFSGLVAGVNVGMSLLGRYQLLTAVTRDLRYSYERTTPYFILTGITESLTMMLPAGFDVVAAAGWQQLAYHGFAGQPDPGADHVKIASGGAGYHLRQRMRLGFTYEWSDRTSPDPTRQYQNRRMFGSLTWGTSQ